MSRSGAAAVVVVSLAGLFVAVWNGAILYRILRPPPPPLPRVTAWSQLEPLRAQIAKLLEEQETESRARSAGRPVRLTPLVTRASHACEAGQRANGAFGEVAQAHGRAAPALRDAQTALQRTCRMWEGFGRSASPSERLALEDRLAGYLNRAAGAFSHAEALIAQDNLPPPADRQKVIWNAIVGLAGGLICALFAWRARVVPRPPAVSAEEAVRAAGEYDGGTARPVDSLGLFFFCDVFDRIPAALALLDAEGRVLRMNHTLEELIACSTEEARSRCYWDVFLEDPAARDDARRRFADTEPSSPIEETWKGRDGEPRRFLWSRELFRDEAGRVTQVLLAAATKGGSIAADAHDTAVQLQNELTMIAGYTELVAEALLTDHAARQDVEQIRQASDRATGLLRRFIEGAVL